MEVEDFIPVPRRLVPLVPPWAGRCVDKQALQGRDKPGRGPSILNSRLETMPIYSTLDLVFTENGKFIPHIPLIPLIPLIPPSTGNGKFIPPRPIPPINMVFLMVTGGMVVLFYPTLRRFHLPRGSKYKAPPLGSEKRRRCGGCTSCCANLLVATT